MSLGGVTRNILYPYLRRINSNKFFKIGHHRSWPARCERKTLHTFKATIPSCFQSTWSIIWNFGNLPRNLDTASSRGDEATSGLSSSASVRSGLRLSSRGASVWDPPPPRNQRILKKGLKLVKASHPFYQSRSFANGGRKSTPISWRNTCLRHRYKGRLSVRFDTLEIPRIRFFSNGVFFCLQSTAGYKIKIDIRAVL